jgi:protoporphyrinogen oxidase
MTLALRLRQAGHEVTLFEGAGQVGGLAAPQELGGFVWDRFYHVVLLSDRNLRALLAELGLADRLQWGTTRTGFYTDGELHSLSSSLEFLTFPPLGIVDKVRLALTILYASRVTDYRRLEGIAVADWLGRLGGRRTLERIWLPLLRSKLGENYRLASASFIWATIARLYGARRSGLKREMFGYVDGGYATVLTQLRERLHALGVEVVCGVPVAEVRETGAGAELRLASGATRAFDAAAVTVPVPRVAALCPQLSAAERERLARVVYQGIVCPSLLLRRPLADFYVTNITDPWVPFTAVIEMTALVDRAQFGGNSLVYLPRYLPQDDPFWAKPDAEIRAEFITALERMYPEFRRDDVLAFQVARAREVMAVTTLHYSERALPPLRTSLPHVFLVNSAQIAAGTLNVNETVGLANTQAAALARHLRAGGRPVVGGDVSDGAHAA